MKRRRKFVGRRLLEIRIEFGMTQSTLAKLADISNSSISFYESDTSDVEVPDSVISKLAQIFHVPVQYFYSPVVRQSYNTVLFRDHTKTPQAERDRTGVYIGWMMDIENYVSQYLSVPKPNLPKFDLPSDPFLITEAMIEDAARTLRFHWGCGLLPINHTVRLLEKNGVLVASLPLDERRIDEATVSTDMGKCYILLNDDYTSSSRRRFTIIHALGHAILHKGVEAERVKTVPLLKQEMERQAHYFALAFLLPRETFKQDLQNPTLQDLKLVKPRWKVSIQAMVKRLYDLGMIDYSRYRNLNIDISKRKWKTEEPFDNEIPVERSILFRQAFEYIEKNKNISRELIHQEVSSFMPVDKFLQLTDLPKDYFAKNNNIVLSLRLNAT